MTTIHDRQQRTQAAPCADDPRDALLGPSFHTGFDPAAEAVRLQHLARLGALAELLEGWPAEAHADHMMTSEHQRRRNVILERIAAVLLPFLDPGEGRRR